MRLLFFLLAALVAGELAAAELAGRVLHVSAALEIELVSEGGARHRIILQGIQLDPRHPERASSAQVRLQGLVAGRFVRVTTQGERNQGKLLGFVDWGGQEINLSLVQDGLAIPVAQQLDPVRYGQYQAAAVWAQERNTGVRPQTQNWGQASPHSVPLLEGPPSKALRH
jgi:endonuclease YncB( thermonuclease family)